MGIIQMALCVHARDTTKNYVQVALNTLARGWSLSTIVTDTWHAMHKERYCVDDLISMQLPGSHPLAPLLVARPPVLVLALPAAVHSRPASLAMQQLQISLTGASQVCAA